MLVSYLFRVRNLIGAVDYQGAASAADIPSPWRPQADRDASRLARMVADRLKRR